ncbi:MAG: hypothetical protein WAK03_13480 [Methylocystis sp.]|jgi:hypothetical protein
MYLTRYVARAALVAIFAAGAFGASSAYAADDGSVGSALLGAFGINTSNSNEKIDYRERAKVVVPPNRQALPEPRSAADSRPSSWPVDQENARRSGPRVANSGPTSGDEPARENLTQPPNGYRRPTQDLSKVQETEAKAKGGWSFDSIKKSIGLGQ